MENSFGQVVQCAHCHGTGVCRVYEDTSCAACLVKAKINTLRQTFVACSSCGGAGQVWVGAHSVQISNIPPTQGEELP